MSVVSTELCRRLEEEIASGSLAPRSRLEEAVLAERFGVSRTPVREALCQLAALGLVVTRPRRTTVVASMTLAQLVEMQEAMVELECACVRLAARRMTEAERDALKDRHTACCRAARSADHEGYDREDTAFHDLVCGASHNRFLQEEVRRLKRRLRPYQRPRHQRYNRSMHSIVEHAEVLDALICGDERLAEERMRSHITIQGETFADWMAGLNISTKAEVCTFA